MALLLLPGRGTRLTQSEEHRDDGRAGLEPLAAEPKARGNRAALGAPVERCQPLREMLDVARIGSKSATLAVQPRWLRKESVDGVYSRRGLLGGLGRGR